MKTIYIFTQYPRSYAPRRFAEEAKLLGLSPKFLSYKNISVKLAKSRFTILHKNKPLKAPEIAIMRSAGKGGRYAITLSAVFNWLKKNKTRVLNETCLSDNERFDKLTQHIEFSQAGVPFIKSEIFMDMELLVDSVDNNYPFIVKSFSGSHGDKVKKITKQSELFHFSRDDAPVLVQPFLKSGQDIRCIVLGHKAVGAMKRIAPKGAFLTNFSAGGEVENFNLKNNPRVKKISEKIAKYLNCEYLGVDLMQDNSGKWRVLEINHFCQFQGFEMSTGINMARRTIEYLLNS